MSGSTSNVEGGHKCTDGVDGHHHHHQEDESMTVDTNLAKFLATEDTDLQEQVYLMEQIAKMRSEGGPITNDTIATIMRGRRSRRRRSAAVAAETAISINVKGKSANNDQIMMMEEEVRQKKKKKIKRKKRAKEEEEATGREKTEKRRRKKGNESESKDTASAAIRNRDGQQQRRRRETSAGETQKTKAKNMTGRERGSHVSRMEALYSDATCPECGESGIPGFWQDCSKCIGDRGKPISKKKSCPVCAKEITCRSFAAHLRNQHEDYYRQEWLPKTARSARGGQLRENTESDVGKEEDKMRKAKGKKQSKADHGKTASSVETRSPKKKKKNEKNRGISPSAALSSEDDQEEWIEEQKFFDKDLES